MNELIHDWNTPAPAKLARVQILDDTLRDGLQATSAQMPTIRQRLTLFDHSVACGTDAQILGLPGAGKAAETRIAALARHAAQSAPWVERLTAIRTHPNDIAAHQRVVDDAGTAMTAALFVGCSPIRAKVEHWDLSEIRKNVASMTAELISAGTEVLFVTEDTTRSRPDVIADIYKAAIGAGASRVCLCDTVGHADPGGAAKLVNFMAELIEQSGTSTGIDWHGHNDRGLALINALTAAENGASRVHTTCLGMGERCGNTSLEQFVAYLAVTGCRPMDHRVAALKPYAEKVRDWCAAPMPNNLPIVGSDAFSTSSGIHASAMYKAMLMTDDDFAGQVYSAIPASMLGRKQRIEIGPMSGASNVRFWLDRHFPSLQASDRKTAETMLMEKAQRSARIFSDQELTAFVVALGRSPVIADGTE